MMTAKYQRLLLTDEAGGLGSMLRTRLRPYVRILRVSDLSPLGAAQDGEELVSCDLADKVAVDALVRGCDATVHMGRISTEHPFEQILEANIKGVFHVYEGARRHGVRRVVFGAEAEVPGILPRHCEHSLDA